MIWSSWLSGKYSFVKWDTSVTLERLKSFPEVLSQASVHVQNAHVNFSSVCFVKISFVCPHTVRHLQYNLNSCIFLCCTSWDTWPKMWEVKMSVSVCLNTSGQQEVLKHPLVLIKGFGFVPYCALYNTYSVAIQWNRMWQAHHMHMWQISCCQCETFIPVSHSPASATAAPRGCRFPGHKDPPRLPSHLAP